MKKADKTTKTADPSEQNLPDQGYGVPASAGSSFPSSAAAPEPANALSPPLNAGIAPVWFDRADELISLHAVRLSDSGRDHFQVTIEPGNCISLSLEFRWHKDGIAVQAQLHSGDFEQLNKHWPQLQQQLQPRGINLAPLQSNATASNKPLRQPANQRPPDKAPAQATEFVFGGSMTESPVSRRQRAKTHRGSEGPV